MAAEDDGGLYGSFLRIMVGLAFTVTITTVIGFGASGNSKLAPEDPWYIGGDMFNQTAVLVYLAIYGFYRIVNHLISSKKCERCKKKETDRLVIGIVKIGDMYLWRRDRAFCRTHLIKEFKNVFVNYNDKMVVFYPCLEEKRGSYTYKYLPMDEVRKLNIPEPKLKKKIIELITSSLDSIEGKCARCDRPASVAFFEQNTFKWKKGGLLSWDIPQIEDIKRKPHNLCSECTFKKIDFSLKNFKSKYAEGLSLPREGDGVFLTLKV